MSDTYQPTDFGAALEAGTALAEPQRACRDGTPYALLPPGYKAESLAHLLPAPPRIQEHLEVLTLDSFLAYLGRFAEIDHAIIFANPTKSTLRAILDYHRKDTPRWGDHTATYRCPPSPEWTAWQARSGKAMTLVEFADHIERNAGDIREPAAAVMLEIGRGLEGKKAVAFKQVHRLQDGSFELAYEETVSAQTRNGNHKVPERFTLGLRPYLGSEPFSVDARLRYRVDRDGAIAITYELMHTDRVLETKFAEICDTVTAAGWAVFAAAR